MTSPNAALAVSIRFRGWELRPAERVLLVRGEPAALGSRAFDVLLALVARQGRAVTKGELLDAAWPGLVVEENNVSVQISALRKLLGVQTIATVAGLGYRLAAAAEDQVAEANLQSLDGGSAPHSRTEPSKSGSAPDLMGRDTDVAALSELLDARRLVSITGTGGVGKTSVAKEVMARRAAKSRDGIHWIDLEPLRDGAQLVPLVAKTLAIDLGGSTSAEDDLISALAQVRATVALDNCEHLLREVTGFVRRALAHAPQVQWLATSQVPLHLSGEVVYRLGPLDVPPPLTGHADAIAYGAVALMANRTAAADRHFSVSESNVANVIDLCRQLDGLPLAIEMAAARVATLGLDSVYQQLEHRLRMPAGSHDGPARHHTLRNTFDWSHGLLSPAEQEVFRRLEPFVGGFCAEMAQQLIRDLDGGPDALDEWQALDLLSALVDKSLVHRVAEEPRRYCLFESARDYAGQRLAVSGETALVRRRHASVVAAWFAPAHADANLLGDQEWGARYVVERHNVRAALVWACEAREPDLVAGLAAALVQIDSFAQLQPEIVQLDIPRDVLDQAAPVLRAAACLEFSWAHYADGSREVATTLARRALEDFEAVGDIAGVYRSLAHLVRLYESRPGLRGEAEEAWSRLRRIDDREVPLRTRLACTLANSFYGGTRTVPRLEELEDLARRSGYAALAAMCRIHVTDQLLIESRFDEAVEAAQRFLDAGEFGPRVKGLLCINQALGLVRLGRDFEARGPALAALRALPRSAHVITDTFAFAAARQGRFVEAALLSGYGTRVRHERDERPDTAEAAIIAETASRLKEGLAAPRLDELLRAGAAMSTADVLKVALPE